MSDFKGEPFCHFFFWRRAECFRQLLKKWYTPPFSKAPRCWVFLLRADIFHSPSTDTVLLKQWLSEQHFYPIYLKALHCSWSHHGACFFLKDIKKKKKSRSSDFFTSSPQFEFSHLLTQFLENHNKFELAKRLFDSKCCNTLLSHK